LERGNRGRHLPPVMTAALGTPNIVIAGRSATTIKL